MHGIVTTPEQNGENNKSLGTPAFWNAERNAQLLDMFASRELSTGEMALRIPGATRSSVAGRLHRLGMRREPGFKLPRHINCKRRSRVKALIVKDEAPAPDQSQLCTMLELTSRRCHAPFGDPVDRDNFRYCGHHVLTCEEAKPLSPYCGYHHRLFHA